MLRGSDHIKLSTGYQTSCGAQRTGRAWRRAHQSFCDAEVDSDLPLKEFLLVKLYHIEESARYKGLYASSLVNMDPETV